MSGWATPTDLARDLLQKGYTSVQIADITDLDAAYVRKVRQRMKGNDPSWQRWRDNNPKKVRAWRSKENKRQRKLRAAKKAH